VQAVLIFTSAVLAIAAADGPDGPGLAPLKPTGFTAQAIVLSPLRVGDTIVRKGKEVAVQIRVSLADYQPRGMEPTLVINGEPRKLDSGVVGVDGRTTTIAFVVDRPELLAEGATFALQMGEKAEERVAIPGALRRDAIKPLAAATVKRERVPSLKEWLAGSHPVRN
jgi:hypothetical protein